LRVGVAALLSEASAGRFRFSCTLGATREGFNVKDARDLRYQLEDIDRRGYPAYKGLRGCYRFEAYELCVNHVQGDPFAAPSDVSVYLTHDSAGWPAGLYDTP